MSDFGIWIKAPDLVVSYRDGAPVSTYAHPIYSGSLLALAAFSPLYSGQGVDVHIDALEAWDAPGGTLITTYTFDDLSAWSNGGGWAINPAGFAYNHGVGAGSGAQVMTTPQPVGANYFVVKNVAFAGTGQPDGWVMVIPYRVGSGPADGGHHDGYRTLLRPNESPIPNSIEVVDGTPPRGAWRVGDGLSY